MSLKRVLGGLIALYNKLHHHSKLVLSRLDVTLSNVRDSIVSKLTETLPRKAQLQIYNSQEQRWIDVVDKLPIDVKSDSVGLARESTLQSIDSKIPNPTAEGNLPVAVAEDQVGIAKDISVVRLAGYQYDYMIRRSGGRLLAVVDFTVKKPDFPVDEFDLGYIKVEGDYLSYEIVSWQTEGLPQPESTGSPYVLKIVVKAGGTVYVRVPVKARYFMPFCSYITLYARDYDVYVLPYVTLGGLLTATRNKLPKRLRLPANKWGRFIVHWFMEAHHGCTEIIVEVYNPQSVDVAVYIGVITACEILAEVKGFCLLFGWEDVFELELSNETLTFTIDIMLSGAIRATAHMYVAYAIAGDGTNPLSISIKVHPAGVTIVTDSQTDTTYKYGDRPFKIYFAKRGVFGHPTMSFEVTLSTSGIGKLGKFIIVLFAFTDEYEYSKDVSTTVPAGQTVTLIDLSSDVKHIKGGSFRITAPSDGDVLLLADTSEGEIVIKRVPAGQTETFTIYGRYTYIKVQNTGTSNTNVWGNVIISDSLLLR